MELTNKKIVLILSPLPPPVGGIASWSVNVIDYLKKENYKNVFHLNTAIKFRQITSISNFQRIIFGIFDSIRIILFFVIEAFKRYPKVVHLTTSASIGLFRDIAIALFCRILNIDLVVHYRFGRIPEISKKKNWEWKLLILLLRLSKSSIVIDKSSFEALKNSLPDIVLFLLPNPCSLEVEMIARKNVLNFKNDEFIFVGHIIESKGIYELVEAFLLMTENLKLKLIGPVDETVKNHLISISKTKDNGNWLKFEGVKSKIEVLELMQTSNALILPSHTEGFPNVVLEAMACGCPILATNVGAIPEMICYPGDNSSGICFGIKNVKSIVEAVLEFNNNPQNKDDMARNGKNRVLENYTLKAVFEKYEEIWYL